MRARGWAWLVVALLAMVPVLAWAQGLDINAAPASDLATLDGVDEELAKAIVREREENGSFTSVDDLARVPGMTAAILAKNRARITAAITAPVPRGSTGGGGGGKGGTLEQEVARVLKKFAQEPTIQQVQDEAISYGRANPSNVDSWRIRSRLRSVAPQFRVGVGYNGDRDYSWRQSAGTSTFLPTQPGQDGAARTDNLNNTVDVAAQATWELSKVIFDPEETRVAREAVRLVKHRDQVVEEVTRRYFERRRLQVELELTPPTDVGERLRKEIRLQELTADIDGLTGGWFTEQVRRKQGK